MIDSVTEHKHHIPDLASFFLSTIRDYIAQFLENLPLETEKKAQKVLRLCEKYDLPDQGWLKTFDFCSPVHQQAHREYFWAHAHVKNHAHVQWPTRETKQTRHWEVSIAPKWRDVKSRVIGYKSLFCVNINHVEFFYFLPVSWLDLMNCLIF